MPEVYENMNVLQTLGQLQDFHYPFTDAMNALGILSPSSSSIDSQMTTGSMPSPMSISTSPSHMSSACITFPNATMLDCQYIEIIEQPVEKFRFRYKSEMMGTHGSLAGASGSNSRKKQAPTVELKNYPGTAVIRCTLVTVDPDRRGPHAHRLVRRVGNQDEDDPHELRVSPELGYQVSFHGMGIIHTAKKHIKDELVKKKKFIALEEAKRKNINVTSLSVREETTIKMEAEGAQKWMGLNSVALCFQAFSENNHGLLIPITDPVYSNPINNLKSALTGELKICRIDKTAGTCDGNDEVFMLVEKVGKKNIKIKFFETNQDDQEIWVDYGRFSELDVHHQYAIVFRTPPYKDLGINEPREIFIQLYRPTDGDCSEPIKFTYKPSDRMTSRKRPRMSQVSSDFSTIPVILNNTVLEDPIYPDLHNSSIDLEKLMDEECPSDEFKEFFSNMTAEEVQAYLKFVPPAENQQLALDGPSKKKHITPYYERLGWLKLKDRRDYFIACLFYKEIRLNYQQLFKSKLDFLPVALRRGDEKLSFAEGIVKSINNILKSRSPKSSEKILALLKERTTFGDTPLHSALRHGQLHLVKFLLVVLASNPVYKTIVNSHTSSGRTCLHYAVEQNQPDVTKALLLLGADPNECDEHGFSPLHIAARIPDAGPCVQALLKGGNVNIEVRDDAGWTALHLAAEAGSIQAIEALVKANVDINSTDMSFGRTALHMAVEGGHKEIVEFLLAKTKIDVNKRNLGGNTALHSAVVNIGDRAAELCQLLLKYGADPAIANHNRESTKESQMAVKNEMESEDEDDQSEGQTSFDLASNKPEILQVLARRSAIESDSMLSSVKIKQEVQEDGEYAEDCVLNEETQSLLVPILDESQCWGKLAKALGFEYLQTTLENSVTSPSRMLLNYMDLQASISIEKLRSVFVELNETKAVQIIDDMVLRRSI